MRWVWEATLFWYIYSNLCLVRFLATLPDKPRNLIVTNITSTSVEIFWEDPKNRGYYGISNFFIKLKRNNVLILTFITGKVNKYMLYNLISYTTYEVFVAAGVSKNQQFGDEARTTFVTLPERGKC